MLRFAKNQQNTNFGGMRLLKTTDKVTFANGEAQITKDLSAYGVGVGGFIAISAASPYPINATSIDGNISTATVYLKTQDPGINGEILVWIVWFLAV